jgi:hypothetical protein
MNAVIAVFNSLSVRGRLLYTAVYVHSDFPNALYIRASRITGITSAPDLVTCSYITKYQFLSDSVLYNDNISYEDYAASMLYERNTSMEQ